MWNSRKIKIIVTKLTSGSEGTGLGEGTDDEEHKEIVRGMKNFHIKIVVTV